MTFKTRVAIIGAGPAGLILARYLAIHNIDTIVIENRSREYVQSRVRAGILEAQLVALLDEIGVGERLHKEGFEHQGIYLQIPGNRHHINFKELVDQTVWAYGQTEIQRDLHKACDVQGQKIFYEVTDVNLVDVNSTKPKVHFTDAHGIKQVIECEAIAGCDGFWGVSRKAIPNVEKDCFEKVYPFSWLGIMANVKPSIDELVYAWHPKGFALNSMRSEKVTRLYLQVEPNDDLAKWSDERCWDELSERLALDGWELERGPITEKSILAMRSFVSNKMQYGRLFLAGDAAHTVPPTGAKGLNLAANDVRLLGETLVELLTKNNQDFADDYSRKALEKVWGATRFSWWFTSMMHTNGDPFDAQLQLAQINHVIKSKYAAADLAEKYVGVR
jgi:p-hydroxybenzoate 3-monooxygenase